MPTDLGGQIESNSADIPAPVGGWNARDPLSLMDPQDAITLINLFPGTSDVSLRNGFTSHATGLGSGVVDSLFEFSAQDGTRKLIGCANNAIYDATSAGAASDITGTTVPTSNRWQGVNFKDATGGSHLLLFNGADVPQKYDGTSVTDNAITGTGLTSSDLVQATIHGARVFAVEKDSTSLWYGGPNAMSGTFTEFDFGSLFRRGGFIQWAATWTRDNSDTTDDLLVVCSNMGEVLAYAGDPTSTFTLVGKAFLPVPLGRRSWFSLGSDLAIMTEEGVVSLARTLPSNTAEISKLSDKINSAFTSAGKLYKSNFGWEAAVYPAGDYCVVNIPVAEGTTSFQYGFNLITGAWFEFRGMNAQSWSLLNENLYFGGTDGTVYKADSGQADNGNNISVNLRTAFSYYGDRARQKRFTLLRPVGAGSATVNFSIGVDIDFKSTATLSTTSSIGTGTPWGSPWGSPWTGSNIPLDDWYSITGIGRAAAIRIEGDFQSINFNLSAFSMIFEAGGIF